MARVAVLGGDGFIGAHLAHRLRNDGHDVTIADLHAMFPRDLRYLGEAFRAVRDADIVFHLAADMGGVGYFHGPADWGASVNNARITLNVIEACVQAGVGRLVYASSVCALATEHDTLTEADLYWGTPDARYGSEKRRGAILCAEAPIDARVALLDTVYGPGQEWDGPRAKFPPAVARKAIEARRTGRLELWGDGTQERCFMFVEDAIDRLVRLADMPADPGPVIVGGDTAVTCEEIARMCLELSGAEGAEIVHVDGPVGKRIRRTDLTKHREVFGDQPTVGYREGFSRLVDWIDGQQRPTTATRTPPDRAVMPAPEVR